MIIRKKVYKWRIIIFQNNSLDIVELFYDISEINRCLRGQVWKHKIG